MRWVAAGLVLAGLGIAGGAGWSVDSPGDSSASQSAMSQDYRASLLALQTGWMSFGQLWFASGR